MKFDIRLWEKDVSGAAVELGREEPLAGVAMNGRHGWKPAAL
jgi:hypothetical protein